MDFKYQIHRRILWKSVGIHWAENNWCASMINLGYHYSPRGCQIADDRSIADTGNKHSNQNNWPSKQLKGCSVKGGFEREWITWRGAAWAVKILHNNNEHWTICFGPVHTTFWIIDYFEKFKHISLSVRIILLAFSACLTPAIFLKRINQNVPIHVISQMRLDIHEKNYEEFKK